MTIPSTLPTPRNVRREEEGPHLSLVRPPATSLSHADASLARAVAALAAEIGPEHAAALIDAAATTARAMKAR